MTSERLPDAPAPSPETRDGAIELALRVFDQKKSETSQGRDPETRLMQQTATPPSRRSSTMPRARYLGAVSLVAIIAGSTAWVTLQEHYAPRYGAVIETHTPPTSPPSNAPPATAPVPPPLQSTAPPQPAPPPVQPQYSPASADPLLRQEATIAPPAPAPEGKIAERERRDPTVAHPRPSAPIAAAPGQHATRVPPGPMAARGLADGVAPGRVAGTFQGGAAPSVRPPEPIPHAAEPVGRDQFDGATPNAFKVVREAPVSTFSIDVDTASYSFARASLNRNVLPQPASVRTEELINYFPYAYETPRSAAEPFRVTTSVFPSPWSEGRKLVRIGIKGYEIQQAERPRANLVFLIDTSGSMSPQNRLPLAKQALQMLLTKLEPTDRVAIVTYAGNAAAALEPTPVSEKARIAAAIDRLQAGGSTAGAEGIRQAYKMAEQNFVQGGINRVILATDGDFNVGITSRDELKGFVERERKKGIFLSVLGFGMGNYNDALMQALAQNGNGAAAFIDTIGEARKVLVEEATSALFPIAKDVKIQVEFNPAAVAEYRLIGYETRLLNRDDFNNDKVDAGEVGSGQTVTALYEIVPVGGPAAVSDLRYSAPAASSPPAGAAPSANEYAFVKIRYKLPQSDTSTLITTPVDRAAEHARLEDAPADARFAASVAAFGEILRGGRHTGQFSYDDVLGLASAARGDDPFGYRAEFLQLVRAAKTASAMQAQRP